MARESYTDPLECSIPGCENTLPAHRWGRTNHPGWFVMKNGTAFCPQHVPSWVSSWQERQRLKKEKP